MRHGSLFSGIGGFDLASEWMGWENVFHCEWNEFAQKVLKYYWPYAESFNDITKTDFTKYANKIDILTGGFPCQPFSLAGQRKGTDDERYLWHEMLRAIQEIKPKCVIAENVYGITNIDGGLVFEQVCLDLENEGYEVQPFVIPASAKNAPHRRERVWFVAYSKSNGLQFRNEATQLRSEEIEMERERNKFAYGIKTNGYQSNASDTNLSRCKTERKLKESTTQNKRIIDSCGRWEQFPTQPPICSRNDGVPAKLDGITFSKWRAESIKGYGNAICPQIAYEIFKIIDTI